MSVFFLPYAKYVTMQQNLALIAELKMEAANTRKILERVPVGKNEWAPHPKSMNLGRLATHVAEIPGWITTTMTTDELDFSQREYKPHIAENPEELVTILNKHVNEAIAALEKSTDEDFNKMWTLRNGEEVYFTLPKKVVLRTLALSHNYHHRAQLGVYSVCSIYRCPACMVHQPTKDSKAITVKY